jgi:hypothetical protein
VPQTVLWTLAKRLRIEALAKASAYSAGEQRWLHATEIRASYGYVEFTEPLIAFRLTRWLYARMPLASRLSPPSPGFAPT